MTTFPFAPNWRDSYTETYEFRTDIIVSRSGKEQRRALRVTPRKGIQFTVTAKKTDLLKFQQFMVAHQTDLLTAGDIPRGVFSTTEMAVGGMSLSVVSVPTWLTNGTTVVLVYRKQVESFTVSTVVGNVVTFTGASGVDWPIETTVCPPLSVRLASPIQGSGKSNTVQEAAIVLAVDPTSLAADEGAPGALLLNGYEVFPFRADWTTEIEVDYQHDSETLDYGFGKISVNVPIVFPTIIRQPSFVHRSAVEIASIRQFFARMKGQWGEFYASSEQNDLPLAAATAAGGNTITVTGTDVYNTFNGSTVFKAFLVEMLDGTQYARAITSMATSGGNTVITFSGTAPVTWSPTTVRMVSWLPRSRFASDQLTIEYQTDSVAQTKLSIMSLEDLLP